MAQSDRHQDENLSKLTRYEKENFIAIQDYIGEGYRLYDHNDVIWDIAEKQTDRIIEATETFFLNTYGIYVEVHNMVSGHNSVTVFVESIHAPFFHTFAVVPIDEKQKSVKSDYVWSQEGEVERGIKGGLYVMAFERAFNKLDKYLDDIVNEFPVVGTPKKVIDNVKANGYMTPFYFISPFGDVFKKLFESFMSDTTFDKTDVHRFFEKNVPEAMYVHINIEFYMEDKNISLDKNILEKIAVDLKRMSGIPKGVYSICLNDNFIDKKRGTGKKNNTLEVSTFIKHGGVF